MRYKFRAASQDRKHLIVVFSGIRPKRSPYDFDGATTHGLRANILWIRDDFDGQYAYYIKNHRGYVVAEAVAALIDDFREKLGLDKEHCTLMGVSKGASGALYHGLVYDYPNLLLTVPRMNIGTGNIEKRPHMVKAMTGAQDAEAVRELDAILPTLLAEDRNLDRNVYLFSSETDHQYTTEVEPYVETYGKYRNFNFIMSDSALITRHIEVTPYNIPMILSVLHALSDGIAPRFGHVENGARTFTGRRPAPTLEAVRDRGHVVTRIDTLEISEGKLEIAGNILRKGTPVPAGTRRKVQVRLSSGANQHHIRLKTVMDRALSNKHFEHEFCDYSRAGFISKGTGADSLAKLPRGTYRFSLVATQEETEYETGSLVLPEGNQTSVHRGRLYQLRTLKGETLLVIRPVIAPVAVGGTTTLENFWAEGQALHVEGAFVVPGQPVSDAEAVTYYLSLKPRRQGADPHSVIWGVGSKPEGVLPAQDPFHDYSKSYFTSPGNDGVELQGVKAGTHDVWVSAEFPNGAVVSSSLGLVIEVATDGSFSAHVFKAPGIATRLRLSCKRRLNTAKRKLLTLGLMRRLAAARKRKPVSKA